MRFCLGLIMCAGCGLTLDAGQRSSGRDASPASDADMKRDDAGMDAGEHRVLDAGAPLDTGGCDEDVDCADPLDCTRDLCVGGACSHEPMPCDADGIACTLDACDPSLGCIPTGSVASCPTRGECVTQACLPGLGCVPTRFGPCPGSNVCGPDGTCRAPRVVKCDGPPDCDDGFACNGSEACVETRCVPGLGCPEGVCELGYCALELGAVCATVRIPGCMP